MSVPGNVRGAGDIAGVGRTLRSTRRNLLLHLLHTHQPVTLAQVRTRRCRRFAEYLGRLGIRRDASLPVPQVRQLDRRKQFDDDVTGLESLASELC